MKRLAVLGIVAALWASSASGEDSKQPAENRNEKSGPRRDEEYRAFMDPKPITIRGYEGEALDPFITRDGRYLFFNSSHFQPAKTDLHYAARVDDLAFEYKGRIGGVNTDGALEAVSSMDRDGNFFFVSPRSFKETSSTIHRGKFKDGAVTDISPIRGLRLDQPGQLNFDAEVSADGNTLYFVDSDMRGRSGPQGGPRAADLSIAVRTGEGFERLDKGSEFLAKVNTRENLEFAPCTSADGLELFFTRFTVKDRAFGIWRAARPRVDVPFEAPQRLAGLDGFVEAPSLAPNGKSLYFHKRDGDRFAIHRISRAAEAEAVDSSPNGARRSDRSCRSSDRSWRPETWRRRRRSRSGR